MGCLSIFRPEPPQTCRLQYAVSRLGLFRSLAMFSGRAGRSFSMIKRQILPTSRAAWVASCPNAAVSASLANPFLLFGMATTNRHLSGEGLAANNRNYPVWLGRVCFFLHLKPSRLAEYCRAHSRLCSSPHCKGQLMTDALTPYSRDNAEATAKASWVPEPRPTWSGMTCATPIWAFSLIL